MKHASWIRFLNGVVFCLAILVYVSTAAAFLVFGWIGMDALIGLFPVSEGASHFVRTLLPYVFLVLPLFFFLLVVIPAETEFFSTAKNLFHDWNGCKCTLCGKVRNQEHDWNRIGCKCKRCGMENPEKHIWDKATCTCKGCGKHHDWDGCTCRICGETNHSWDGCTCRTCGATRDYDHKWSYLTDYDMVCDRCGIRKSLGDDDT